MRRAFRVALIGLLCAGVVGCKKPKNPADGSTAEQTSADLGGVKVVEIDATGVGNSRGAAVLDAINMAVQQVNGVAVSFNQGAISEPDSNTIQAASGGSVQGFTVTSAKQDSSSLQWQVALKVRVNKFVAPESASLPKVAVVYPRLHQASYVIGDQVLSGDNAATSIMAIISDSLRKSNRFAVIDHKQDASIDEELAHIQPGAAPPAEIAKLGQRLSADLLIIPEINALNYHKSTRLLHFSGRELNSFAGGADISFSVVNVATGQTVLSEHFGTQFPATPPSVYGAQRVGIGTVNSYLAGLTDQFTQRFILKYFPIAIIKLEGDTAILNQGAAMLKVGETYNAIRLGEDVKDPQTGQSLGRLESPVGTVQIVKVAEKMAFGKFSGKLDPAQFRPGQIQLRGQLQGAAPASSAAAAPHSAHAQAPHKASRHKGGDEFNAPFD